MFKRKATDGKPFGLLSVDFFVQAKKRSETKRAKEAFHFILRSFTKGETKAQRRAVQCERIDGKRTDCYSQIFWYLQNWDGVTGAVYAENMRINVTSQQFF